MKGKGKGSAKELDTLYTVKISSEAKKDVVKSKQGQQIWYKWQVKVQWEKGGSRDTFDRLLKSVQYELHETFDNPVRNFSKAPFKVEDSCYAAFVMKVRLLYGGAKIGLEDVFDFDLKVPMPGEPKRKWSVVHQCKFVSKAQAQAQAKAGAGAAMKKGKTKKTDAIVAEPLGAAGAKPQSAAAKKKAAVEEKKKKAALAVKAKTDPSKRAAAAAAAAAPAPSSSGTAAASATKPTTTTAAAARNAKRKAAAAPEASASALKRVDSGKAAAAAVGRKGRAPVSMNGQERMMLKIKLKHNMKKLAEGLHSLDEIGMGKAEAIVKQFAASDEYEYKACSPTAPGYRKVGFDLYNMNHATLDALNLLLPEPRTKS